jgi:hypothetical protein
VKLDPKARLYNQPTGCSAYGQLPAGPTVKFEKDEKEEELFYILFLP